MTIGAKGNQKVVDNMSIILKYGKEEIGINLPESKVMEIVRPELEKPTRDPRTLVANSLDSPEGKKELKKVVKSFERNQSITITLEDHTRPVPTEPVVIPLLEKLNSIGVPKKNITFLIATGNHRDLTKEEMMELRNIVGSGPALVNHHSANQSELTRVGELTYPDGTKKDLLVNSSLISADITLLTGDVEFHQLYGYGGGAKSILPGTADAESVRFNHSLMDIPEAQSGNLNNPLRDAAEKAADLVGVDFSVNLVLNPEKEVIDCYSGDVHKAFNKAVNKVDELYKVPYGQKSHLVVVEAGGYPKDIDLYQAQKAVENGLELVEPGGDLVLVAKCPDGWGSSTFKDWVSSVDNLDQVEEKINEKFVIGGHKAYIYAKEKRQANLYLISDLKDNPDLRKIFTPITREALEEKAKEVSSISILKLGSSTVPVKEHK
ncbi:nickel-dependent lactate racemase [Candidatus Bipolaricaulota bacterium]|nr:nickel-dependent lactate racemase [Candidatus Bipolaricaulota bacterium]